jgi:hypothetical protein
MRALRLPGSSTDQNNQAGKRPILGNGLPRQFQKMVPIATDDNSLFPLRPFKDRHIRRGGRQDFAQSPHFMLPLPEQFLHLFRHVVVEQKLHYKASLICSATSASISVR